MRIFVSVKRFRRAGGSTWASPLTFVVIITTACITGWYALVSIGRCSRRRRGLRNKNRLHCCLKFTVYVKLNLLRDVQISNNSGTVHCDYRTAGLNASPPCKFRNVFCRVNVINVLVSLCDAV